MRGYDSWCFIKYRIIVRENYRTIVPKANFFFTRIKYTVDIFLWKIHKTQKYVNKNISGKAFDVHLLLTFKISWFETKWISASNEVSTLDTRNVRQIPERLSWITTRLLRRLHTERARQRLHHSSLSRSSPYALARPSASLDLLLARPTHARSLANVLGVRICVYTRILSGERVHLGYVARNARLMHERACTFDSTRASPWMRIRETE